MTDTILEGRGTKNFKACVSTVFLMLGRVGGAGLHSGHILFAKTAAYFSLKWKLGNKTKV